MLYVIVTKMNNKWFRKMEDKYLNSICSNQDQVSDPEFWACGWLGTEDQSFNIQKSLVSLCKMESDQMALKQLPLLCDNESMSRKHYFPHI